ncbi:hypothetical protein [Pseudonocardia spinosispora]|uniref:hypothetical protein n=1 Tax=Pseudonocardia spinosispora TaxID=103441 RepID=UPI00041B358E|nr:hypothetical protein [Pseudonocardia spinosispora]
MNVQVKARSPQEHALDYVRRSSAGYALPPTLLSFDTHFRQVIAPGRARAEIQRVCGVDVGFDLADDSLSAMLALTLLPAHSGNRDLISLLYQQVKQSRRGYRFRVFPKAPVSAAGTDCTAIAVTGMHRHQLLVDQQADMFASELLLASTVWDAEVGPHAGVMPVYWDDEPDSDRPLRERRHDAVIGANALYAIHLAKGHTADIVPTLDYLTEHLTSRAYLSGTRHYPSPDAFLCAAAELCAACERCDDKLGGLVRRALTERMSDRGVCFAAIDMALRIIAADLLGIQTRQPQRREALAALQDRDGSWPACPYYRMGRIPLYFGSRSLTTLFALRALEPGGADQP